MKNVLMKSKHIIHWVHSHGIVIGSVALAVSLVGIFTYRYLQLKKQVTAFDPDPKKREEQAKKEVEGYVHHISTFMALPTGMPTVATVTDAEKLRTQSFFSQSENGDKVLIYPEIKKAILYRPTTGKIIDVATLTGTSDAPVLLTPTPTMTPYRFTIWNGTSITGLVKRYEETLKERVPNATVEDMGNTKKQEYTKTVLIDMHGDKKEIAESLAATLGISVSTFPKNEATPSSKPDFLIILGSDQKK